MTAADRYRSAIEACDLPGLLATLSPQVALRSPITASYVFEGFDDVAELMTVVYEDVGIEDAEVIAHFSGDSSASLFHRAKLGGLPIEEATLLRIDDQDLISEITLSIRPLPALAGVIGKLGPPLARRRGRGRATITRSFGAPLVAATRGGERVIPWLLRRPGQPAR